MHIAMKAQHDNGAANTRHAVAGFAPLDEADAGFNSHNTPPPDDEPDTIVGQLNKLRRTVEVDYDRRFQRIESDLRWVIMLTSAQLVAIVGGAIATFTLT